MNTVSINGIDFVRRDAMSETLKGVSAYFPIEWNFGSDPSDGINGPPVDDGGVIYIIRDEDANLFDEPDLIAKTSILELVSYCIEGWKHRDGYTDPDDFKRSDAIAYALRSAADMLDAAKRPNVTTQEKTA